ncbi:nitrous oxide reductase accessory protein NosL [Roseovarius salinarum]|uniref:nitrous oxide reductase accessory protein NosL n=1 Tax=Roseovarius salinarum TaxID=1981892 RepID=UPI000C33809E|nr:nitrous oxide reductase accessory protein NosL [Roseovarius salinarum]
MKRTFLVAALLLAACQEEEAKAPEPVTMTADALSHFCRMQVAAHPGPKAQIHLSGFPDPIFFAQVRDALAYVKGPEREAEVTAFYVSDMAAAESWETPGADNWIAAGSAEFVVGSEARGGMGAPEIVPFSGAGAARDFADRKGGDLMTLKDIPAETVLAPVDVAPEEEPKS